MTRWSVPRLRKCNGQYLVIDWMVDGQQEESGLTPRFLQDNKSGVKEIP